MKREPYGSENILRPPKETRINKRGHSPVINEKSRELAEGQLKNYLNSTNIDDEDFYAIPDEKRYDVNCSTDLSKLNSNARIKLMYEKSKRTKEKLSEMRTKQNRKAIESCTFKPIISNRAKISKPIYRKKSKVHSSKDKEFFECTFQPQLFKKLPYSNDKQIIKNKNKSDEKENKFAFPKIQRKLLEIYITIAEGKKELLLLRKGDNPEVEINRFAHIHKLDNEGRVKLKQLMKIELEKQI